MQIYTTYYNSPVGWLEIQCSDKYIKSVLFAEKEGLECADHILMHKTPKPPEENRNNAQ